jgi:23S rRNA (pseudouridine1915-N3)-methyltransferase
MEAGRLVRLRFLWPGKIKNKDLRNLQDQYLEKIGRLEPCSLVETREARGLTERDSEKILEIEARGLEKHLSNDYIICLFDGGREMTSAELAVFLEKASRESGPAVTFIVGGFLGLAESVLRQARLRLSLSKMTMSQELCRVVLLEQVYRALTIMKGKHYAK